MSQLNRLMGEQARQVLMIAIGFLDRFFLTAVLYRVWGQNQFEAWSICLSISGIAGLFELGFSHYFSNKLVTAVEAGNRPEIDRTIALSKTVLLLCGLVVTAVTVGLLFNWRIPADHSGLYSGIVWATLLLGLQNGLRIATAWTASLYRAYRQYGRFISLTIAVELTRVVATGVIVFGGGGMVVAAAVTLLSTAIIQAFGMQADVFARFKAKPFGFSLPTLRELKTILAVSSAIGAQIMPLVLLTYVPVLLLTSGQAAAGVISAFVLQRTLSGMPRSLLQSLGIIVGQECARLVAAGNRSGATEILKVSGKAFAVLSGLMAGVLVAAGREIIFLWTNDASIFQVEYMLVGVLPMLLGSVSVVTHNVLSSMNRPYLPAIGRLLQFALTLVIALAGPFQSPVLNMFVAISVGELVGFVPIAYIAVWRILPGADVVFHLRAIAWTLLAALVSSAITLASLRLFDAHTPVALLVAFAVAGIGCALFFWTIGIDKTVRRALLQRWPIARKLNF